MGLVKLRNKWFGTEVEGELVHEWPDCYTLKVNGHNTRYMKDFWEEVE